MANRAQLLRERLNVGFVVGDGGLGRMLDATGCLQPGQPEEIANTAHPKQVVAVHRAFVEAGSQLIETNSFQGSRVKLAKAGLGDRTVELNQAAARLAKEAAGDAVFVGGSIGPSGELLQPLGDLPASQAAAAFEEQAAALAEGGVDCFVVETFFDLEEARLAVFAAKQTGLPVLVSLAFGAEGKTIFGVDAEQASRELTALGVDAVGANCGDLTPAEMVAVLKAMRAHTDLPLVAQPNAGRPQLLEGKTVYAERPEAMADAAEQFLALKAGLIGGCCGTRPEHIAAIAKRLLKRNGG